MGVTVLRTVLKMDAGPIAAQSPPVADEGPNAMAFSNDGAWVVAAFDDGHARVVLLLLSARADDIAAAAKKKRTEQKKHDYLTITAPANAVAQCGLLLPQRRDQLLLHFRARTH